MNTAISRLNQSLRRLRIDSLFHLKSKKLRFNTSLESVDDGKIRGWAYCHQRPDAHVYVEIYADGKLIAQGIADQYRSDLETANMGNGEHGFILALLSDFSVHQKTNISVMCNGGYQAKIDSINLKCSKIREYSVDDISFAEAENHQNLTQQLPYSWHSEGLEFLNLVIDEAFQCGNLLVVVGWCTSQHQLGLKVKGKQLVTQVKRVARPDVADAFQLNNGESLGFYLVAFSNNECVPIQLTAKAVRTNEFLDSCPFALSRYSRKHDVYLSDLGATLASLALKLQPHSELWCGLINKIPASSTIQLKAEGYLEGGAVCELTGEAVVVGWVVNAPEVTIWLEDGKGRTWPINGYHFFRQDVNEIAGKKFGVSGLSAGFLVRIAGAVAHEKILLKALSVDGVHILGASDLRKLPIDAKEAAKWLFGLVTPLTEFHRRIVEIDRPIIDALINSQVNNWNDLPVVQRKIGNGPHQALVSLVIPLYARIDFVEHQLIEFYEDDWLKCNAEIIYVIDDPCLLEEFTRKAEDLYRLYKIPITWIWGNANRGFAGANNLGASHTASKYLLFVNSDVIPQTSGWAQALIQALIDFPDVGAIGPRLVFADGSIQHAGMVFQQKDELGIWVNHHPNMGIDPSLDVHKQMAYVPAITGACLAMRHIDFDRIGGWDTGYLIGDFEDSDLCLKLREQGQQIAYFPEVQLTHLERQSFKLVGEANFRQKVVIYNAVRHQSRWNDLISQPFTQTKAIQ